MDFSNTPNFTQSGPSNFIKLILSICLSTVLIVSDHYYHLTDKTRESVSIIFYPLQWVVNYPVELYNKGSDFFAETHKLSIENADLNQKNLALSAELIQQNAVIKEFNELKKIHQLKETSVSSGTIAEVIFVSKDPFTHKIIINKGEDQQLSLGQPVLDEMGLIGQITRVNPLTSEVTLLNDEAISIPVMVERTGQRALLYGYGNSIELPYLPPNSDIKVNDRLLTSGIDGIYAPGLPVAVITDVKKNSGSQFPIIKCQVLSKLEDSRFVLVMPAVQVLQPMEINSSDALSAQ